MRYIDLSHPIYDHMHAGTHVDCPMHLVNSTSFIGQYPLDKFMGRPSCND